MKHSHTTISAWAARAAMFCATVGIAAAASASVDTSPQPGGIYRLKPGIYVAQDVPCEDPPNAAIRQYDGHGISTAHSHACKASVRARKGMRYTVDQSCIDAGAGPGRRFVQRQQITVRDALSFSQSIGGSSTSYRYCPVYQLPPSLRKGVR